MPATTKNLSPQQRWELIVRRRAVAAAVVDARKATGMTQAELAEKSGLSRAAIMRIEAGTASLGLDRLWSLARALGTKPSPLLAAAEADPDAERTLQPEQ